MDKLIVSCRSSFLKNRQASDNAIIIQEIISHFKKMNGEKGTLILKFDLEKPLVNWVVVYQRNTQLLSFPS